MNDPILTDFSKTAPTTFERDRRGFAGPFEVYADRKDKPFVMLASGLSHNGGRTQHLMTPAEAKALGNALIDAAEFADHPMMADMFGKGRA